MIELNLNDKRKVTAKAFTMNFTYSGLLTYQTSEGINRNIYERADYPGNWGNRAVLKLKPKEVDFKSVLDPCYYCVWLESEWKQHKESDGSLLVVIWFDDIPNERSIEHMITRGVKDIDWAGHAEDYAI